jgi:hypothetical protein
MLKKFFPVLIAAGIFAAANTSYGADVKVYQGLGNTTNFRVGPGKDDKGVQVYSFNFIEASVIFDENGKIIDALVDGLEISTPNYDGPSMPHLSGWPGTEGYNVTDHETGKVTGVSRNTVEEIEKEVNGWKTKRQRGIDYGMNPKNEWNKQMDHFQKIFKGKTIEELEDKFKKLYSDINGRPLKANSKNEKDIEKYNKLTADEKQEVADIVAGATMSLRDAHGDILGAIKNAYENRVEVIIPVK